MILEKESGLLHSEIKKRNTEIPSLLGKNTSLLFHLPEEVNARNQLLDKYFQRPTAQTRLLQTIQYVWGEPPLKKLGENIEIRHVDTKKLHSYSSLLCPKPVPKVISTDLIPFATATVFLKNHARYDVFHQSGIPQLDEETRQTIAHSLSLSLAMNDGELIPDYLKRIKESFPNPSMNQLLIINLIEIAGYIDEQVSIHPKMRGKKLFAMEFLDLAFDVLMDFENFKSSESLGSIHNSDLDMVLHPERNHPPDSLVTILLNRFPQIASALPQAPNKRRLKFLDILGVNPNNLTLVDNYGVLKNGKNGIFAFPHKDGYRNPKATYNWGEMALLHFILENSPGKKPGEVGAFTLSDSNIFLNSLPAAIPLNFRKGLFDMLTKLASSFGVGVVDIDRKNPAKGNQKIKDVLLADKSIIIAPEGDGWLKEMIYAMPGTGSWATESGKPVIPVTFREDKQTNGEYKYQVIIHHPLDFTALKSQTNINAINHGAMMIAASSLLPSERGIYGNRDVMKKLKVPELLKVYPERAEMEKALGFEFD